MTIAKISIEKSESQLPKSLTRGLAELKLVRAGKKKTTNMGDFLKELKNGKNKK